MSAFVRLPWGALACAHRSLRRPGWLHVVTAGDGVRSLVGDSVSATLFLSRWQGRASRCLLGQELRKPLLCNGSVDLLSRMSEDEVVYCNFYYVIIPSEPENGLDTALAGIRSRVYTHPVCLMLNEKDAQF